MRKRYFLYGYNYLVYTVPLFTATEDLLTIAAHLYFLSNLNPFANTINFFSSMESNFSYNVLQ